MVKFGGVKIEGMVNTGMRRGEEGKICHGISS